MHSHLSRSSALVLGLLAAGCGSSQPDPGSTDPTTDEKAPLVVQTDKGPVEGQVAGSTRTFLGIPYAAPPIGELRWKAPAPPAAWTETFKASEKGPACPQSNILTGAFDKTTNEDCLTVNVWTPERPASSALPVLVWIHGGAYTMGSGGDASYDGQVLSEKTGSIVVTLNYRLGPLGFLAHPLLKAEDPSHPSTGGYGIEDQRAALAWVKANIAAFGGDPARVTLFGESAGGASTCFHMVSPKSKGLFQRAIIESGPCDLVVAEADANAQAEEFVAALGCKESQDVAACLRGKSAEEVLKALPLSGDLISGEGASWSPVVDGWNVADAPSKLLAAGSFEKVPTILGSNADEGTLFFQLGGPSLTVADDAAFELVAEKLVPGHGKEVVEHYPSATYGSAQKALMAAVGDGAFVCPTRQAARAIAKAGAATYLYHFTYAPKDSPLGDLGAYHSAEIKYVFGVPGQLSPNELTEEELTISAAMMGYWSHHAEAGDPNGEGAAAWPKYDAATDESLTIDVTIKAEAGVRKDLCDFWDSTAFGSGG